MKRKKSPTQAISEEEKSMLDGLAKIVYEQIIEDVRRSSLLEKSPKGFHFDREGYTCCLCSNPTRGENSWYDKHGLKCICCQRAIDKKTIPVSILYNKDSYYTKTNLELSFNLTTAIINKWGKAGILKDRILPDITGKKTHLQVFLLRDNKKFLPPPKKLRVGGPVKETGKNGMEEFVFYPWYYFVDPIEHLKNYGIAAYFKVTD